MTKPNRSHASRKRPAFLAALATGTTVAEAAKLAGIDVSNAYQWRRSDAAFAAEWDDAYRRGGDALHAEAMRRAVTGVDEPVYWQGKVVGNIRKYSDTLLIFLMKARDPLRFDDSARRAAIERQWAKDDDELGKGETQAAPLVLDLLNQLAVRLAAQPVNRQQPLRNEFVGA